MPSQPRTVLDGLEGLWEGAAAGWRETNRLREEAEAAKLRAQRQVVQAASRGVQEAASGVKAGGARAGQVVEALLGHRTTDRPEAGPVNYREVAKRVRTTQGEIGRNLSGPRASPYPEAAAGAWPAAAVGWVNRVRPGGEWDDKHQHPKAEIGRYERQGNFSYGATAAALGLPRELALRGAGLAQRAGAVGDAVAGRRIRERAGGLAAPYGDDPRDQRAISDGYAYGRLLTKRGPER